MSEPTPEERRALFRVVRGEPSDDELAALTVTLAALTGNEPSPVPVSQGTWNTPRLRTALHPGPGAWRTSTWPC